jgi:hypothetical protein
MLEPFCPILAPIAATTRGFAALGDHERLPGRFHARLAAVASRG